MKQEVIDMLTRKYNELEHIDIRTCLKYHFVYNEVNVNIFFDAYDELNPSLTMILVFEKDYYYFPLNIKNVNIRKEYLNDLPNSMLNNILVDNQLTAFFENIEKELLSSKPHINYYTKEKIFVNTIKYSKDKEKLPFLSGIRKVRMQDTTLSMLNETLGIDVEILKKIQNENMTLVRTGDILRRKKITLILNENDIHLD